MPSLIDANAIQSIFAPAKPDGSYDGQFLSYFRSISDGRPLLLLAFAPKAAGTFFCHAAIDAVGGQLIRASHALGGRDCTPYLPTFVGHFLDVDAAPAVMFGHMQAFGSNRKFLEMFGLKPVIMIRNIPDMLASFWDMLERDPTARADGLNCLIPENFLAMSRAEKARFMIEIVAPWYVSYFATWRKYSIEAPQTVCVLRFEDFRKNPPAILHKALTHAGFVVSRSKCETAIMKGWKQKELLRFNKGISGRGRAYFSADCLERLSQMLAHYPQLVPWLAELGGVATAAPIRQAS